MRRSPLRRGGLWLLLACSLACPRKAPELFPPAPGAFPLDRALALAERSRDSLSLPGAEEAGYTIPTRFGVIDAVLADPLALPSLAEEIALALDAATEPTALFAALLPLDPRGGAAPPPPREARPEHPVGARHLPGLPLPSELIASPRWAVRTAHLPAPWPEAVAALLLSLEAIDAQAEQWDRRGGAPRRPPRAADEYFVDAATGELRFLTHPVGVQLEFLNEAAPLHLGAMEDAGLRLLGEARTWASTLRGATASLPTSDGPLLALETALGKVVIGSTGSDEIGGDLLLALDPAGDDRWTGGSGSNVGVPARAALALDLGGADHYTSDRAHSQGAGFLGVGVLVDAGPEGDQYDGRTHAQGAGFMGVGILWDEGGDDTFAADAFAQGAGTFGLGLLMDVAGSDTVMARARAQGFGSTGGLGALIDRAGNDTRRVGVAGSDRFGPGGGGGQGCGFGTRSFPFSLDVALHGGAGLLYDGAGDDVYFGSAFAQGAAWFLSLGMLLERGGNDRYTGQESSQASAEHLAAAILQDADGSDIYSGTERIQGYAADRSVAILDDRGGDADGHRLGNTGPGAADAGTEGLGFVRQTHALAVVVDDGGDDVRRAASDALAAGIHASEAGRDGLALLLDLGGADRYEVSVLAPGTNPADGATWFLAELGLGMDLDAAAAGQLPLPGWSPWTRDVAGAFEDTGGRRPVPPGPPRASRADGSPAERQRFAQNAFGSWLAAPPEPEDPTLAAVRTLAADRDPRVRRAAGFALLAAELPEGLDAVLASLTFRSADHDRVHPAGSTMARLAALTGQELGFDDRALARWWAAEQIHEPLHARLPGWRLVERARSVSEAGDVESAASLCDQALLASGGDPALRRVAGNLMAVWADVLSDPESHLLHDPARAADVARRATRWSEGSAGPFVSLARALVTLEELDLARRTVQQATLLDPDHSEVMALRRALGLEPPAR